MQEAGTIVHVAGSGRAIVRLSRAVDEGRVLCDRRSSAVARVVELIGPVSAPFASAAPMSNSISKYVGRRVYESAGGGDKRRRDKEGEEEGRRGRRQAAREAAGGAGGGRRRQAGGPRAGGRWRR